MDNVVKDILYLSGNRLMYKRLYYSGIIAFVIMFVFSILFYKERTILCDLAYNLFCIILNDSFSIQHFRYGDALTQIFPLAGLKAGLSLDSLLMLYSSGFVVLYFVCYLIAGSIFKKYEFALCILLFHILFTAETFYYVISPLIEGITLLLLLLTYFAWRQENISKRPALFMLPAFALLAFFHPLLIFPMSFCVLFFRWHEKPVIDDRSLLFGGLIFFTTLVLKSLLIHAPYEKHAMGGLRNFITLFPDYINLYSHKIFFQKCITEYYWIPILFITIVVHYCVKKEWKKLGLFSLSIPCYLLLVNISYPHKTTPAFYMENLYTPLAAMLAIPFIFDVLPLLVNKRLALPVFTLILVSGCVRFYTTHHRFTARLNWERRFLTEHADKKMIYRASNVPMDTLQMIWGTPYEFWLLSTTERGKTASIIIDDNPAERIWATGLTKSLLVNWNTIPYEKLNQKYFHLTDTTSGYLIY